MKQELMTTKELAAYARVSESFLKKKRMEGTGPAFLKLGTKKVVYRLTDVDAYFAAAKKQNNCNV